MSTIAIFLSPKSSSGSFVYSLAAHGLIAAALVFGLNLQLSKPVAEDQYVDLGYEVLDEAPTKAPPKPPVEEKMEEMQDKTSEIAGVQKENKTELGVGVDAKDSKKDIPYYKVKPKYPRAALLEGKEGWVMFEVDITETGEVENIRVIDGENRDLFQSPAKQAVAKFKYRPFVDEGGKAIRKLNHSVRVDFNLTEETDGDRASL